VSDDSAESMTASPADDLHAILVEKGAFLTEVIVVHSQLHRKGRSGHFAAVYSSKDPQVL
jgi:hypothetical protein